MNNLEENRMLILEDFNFWSNRLEYVKLMNDLNNNVITVEEFHDKFCYMCRLDRDIVSQWDDLKYLQVKRFEGFSVLMSKLFCDCDAFEPNPFLRDSFSISDEELRNAAISILLEIETRYL